MRQPRRGASVVVDIPLASGMWPRLWWSPSGLASFLPLHAAGHHATRLDQTPLTVMDRVVSAYTPTLRALSHARRAVTDAAPGPGRAPLVVAMPHTPGAADLPGAAAEAEVLRSRFPSARSLEGPAATYADVTAALARSPWAHFACHATTDLASPSAGRLLLHDHVTHPLTVDALSRLNLDQADLAYLSACGTARPGWELADEALHLAAACQIAGYRHVISTLWPIEDRAAIEIAADVYETLAGGRGRAEAAEALHAAVRLCRNRGAERPSTWAAYVCYGA